MREKRNFCPKIGFIKKKIGFSTCKPFSIGMNKEE
jgi:hypothetical protein